ncbi:hypothetical protein [Acetobacter thailandicus]|uniref:Uncharacterized protein n=1 Tax=Acetobacter thailandicus TaxID=1502842 RepID=A0ABT3QH95_9PROT|nr:hypothetical protein [Acetobacter thailandicus]MCX2564661.1 hypothetical protein [Acetobacter thailandicus]NHN96165.1 hypothetical protein [Acetobacter thailandicus]
MAGKVKNNENNKSAANDNNLDGGDKYQIDEVAMTISRLIGRKMAREYWDKISFANDNKSSSFDNINDRN